MGNKRLMSLVLALTIVITGFMELGGVSQVHATSPVPPTGTGTTDNPLTITTVENLAWFAQEVNSGVNNIHAVLGGNIDASGWTAEPIGSNSTPFNGTFDGDGYVIRNLTITNGLGGEVGFIGSLGSTGVVQDIGLEDVNIVGVSRAGGIASRSETGSQIINSYVTGSIQADTGYGKAGGLVGELSGEITGSYASVTVSGSNAGGLVGLSNAGNITNSYATGNISGGSDTTGAILGYLSNNTQINNIYWDSSMSVTENGVGQSPIKGVGIVLSGSDTTEGKTMAEITALLSPPVHGGEGSGDDGEPDGGTTPPPAGGDTVPLDGDIDITGQVHSTIVRVSFPLSINFIINPNAEREEERLIAVPAQVVNETNAPVEFQILGITADVATPTKVVEPTKFAPAQWSKLGVADTKTNIALGLKEVGTGITYWSQDESHGISPFSVLGLYRIDAMANTQVEIVAQNGLAWDGARVLNYKLHVRIDLADY